MNPCEHIKRFNEADGSPGKSVKIQTFFPEKNGRKSLEYFQFIASTYLSQEYALYLSYFMSQQLPTGTSNFFQDFTKGKPVLAALNVVRLSVYVSRKSR